MEQDYFIEPEEALKEESSEGSKSKKLDPYLRILIFQGVICLIVIIFCLIIKAFFVDFFGDVKNWYDKKFKENTSPSIVLEEDQKEGKGGPKIIESSNVLNGFSSPVIGVLTSSYGYRADPFTGESAIHHGVDIATKSGTPIKAALSGVVEQAEFSNGDYGNFIIINHGGFETLYAHCESLNASVGDKVEHGDVIATVGSTGRSTGPHLHFEIIIGDARIDPTPFIKIENK